MTVSERLLKYVSYWTTSDEESETTPSTLRQFDLGKELAQELKDLGLKDVTISDNCYVYALLPATEGRENVPSVGFISHMDTAPDYNGKDVKPQIIENYDGKDVVLEGTGAKLLVSDFPELADFKGRTLITTDGTSLLGADDKAGIAEIMAAVEYIIKNDVPHGDIWVGFTPDEEIGRGSDKFDLDTFKAKFAYTLDGDYEGEIAWENFNAAAAEIKITGKSVHPGEAKGLMVNAGLIAAEIAGEFPADQTPATTEGREGFFHLIQMSGDVSSASLVYIIRDHDAEKYQAKMNFMKDVVARYQEKYGVEAIALDMHEQYHNMSEIMVNHMDVIELANDAIRSVGLDPISRPVRGGTDGAMLSFKGLPCPNLGTGGYGFHGPFEHITVEAMETAVKIVVYIASHVA